MAARGTQHRLLLFLGGIALLAGGCTDRRVPIRKVQANLEQPGSSGPPQSLVAVSDIRFNGQDINVWTMIAKGNSIYTTGTPYGFLRMATENPASPQLIFAVSEQIDRLFPRWVAPWYARGALAVTGTRAFMSGTVGASVIDFSETNRPKEVNRDPDYVDDDDPSNVVADDAKIWSAAAIAGNYLFAFRQSDFVLTYRLNGSQLQLVGKDSYGDETGSCCANAATYFNGQVYVAFRSRLLFFSVSANGRLVNAREYVGLQANYVASTPNHLYVYHEGSFDVNGGSSFPRGIYVFNKQGKNVGFLPAYPSIFAVSQNDSHIFVVGPQYSNGGAIRVMRIIWNRTL